MSKKLFTEKQVVRFWNKVEKKGKDDCWEWRGAKFQNGYGMIVRENRKWLAHRASWIIHNGEIPKGSHHGTMCILHKCDNPPCVNPDHLILGTQQDNTKDRVKKKRTSTTHQLKGEGCGRSKLTEEVVNIIRKLNERSDLTQKHIAKEFNTDPSNVSYIVTRKSWKHI